MAFVAVNPIGFNPNLAGVQRSPLAHNQGGGAQANPLDGFQASLQVAQTEASPPPKELTLQVTPSQMATQAFQTNLAMLAMSGTSVSVVLLAEGAVIAPQANVPAPQPAPATAPKATGQPGSFGQADIDSARSFVFQAECDVRRLEGKQWHRYVSDYGNVEHSMCSGDLAEAVSYLDRAKSDLTAAEAKLKALDHDGARKSVQSARHFAFAADGAARRAEDREEGTFKNRVYHAEAAAHRRRDDEERNRYGHGGYMSSSNW